jgi:hypothetical protein
MVEGRVDDAVAEGELLSTSNGVGGIVGGEFGLLGGEIDSSFVPQSVQNLLLSRLDAPQLLQIFIFSHIITK